jgi:hypothetical protein
VQGATHVATGASPSSCTLEQYTRDTELDDEEDVGGREGRGLAGESDEGETWSEKGGHEAAATACEAVSPEAVSPDARLPAMVNI